MTSVLQPGRAAVRWGEQIALAGVNLTRWSASNLLLGLRFDRIESGYVDSFTGDPALRQTVLAEARTRPGRSGPSGRRLIAAASRCAAPQWI